MGIARELVISYGVWSSEGLQVDDPYSITLDFGSVSISFRIVVSKNTPEEFESACSSLELALSLRDKSLTIQGPDGTEWGAYVFGANALNTTCAVSKSGVRAYDTGRSRSYTATFTSYRPANDNNGFAVIDAKITHRPSRQRVLSITGEVRSGGALLSYQSGIVAKEQAIMAMLSSATWELIDEDYDYDRTNHILKFSRTNVELLYDEPDPEVVVGQQVSFTRLTAYPGDGDPSTNRPERFVLQYECNVDKERLTGDVEISDLYEDTIQPWLIGKFVAVWDPKQFAIVEHQRNMSPTMNTISARMVILAYMDGGDLVEYAESNQFQDIRSIDYTPVWDGSELDAYADQQFMTRLKMSDISKTMLGEHEAAEGLAENNVRGSGWNRLQSSTSKRPLWLGEGEDRVRITMLTEQTVERWTRKPKLAPPITPVYPRGEAPTYTPNRDPRR